MTSEKGAIQPCQIPENNPALSPADAEPSPGTQELIIRVKIIRSKIFNLDFICFFTVTSDINIIYDNKYEKNTFFADIVYFYYSGTG